ncbi:zinc-dependent alcohol dehydrogenase [Chromohalobacter moromii]|uniref:Zinc-binding alcohol dehydrogenase n=1 Tax=Chromohalobacter moromii TaxID=2860329 RepID=A0A9X3B2X6_9GAMM|nr:zinc-binding alcohol dehydrogenase [Chromohalobacter moromii]MCK2044652.1 zinc-binding alcohol dehydrogenase [Chromohalobacter moromii]MCT8504194.1 zinc-binding alcohol dehydrogenase [Chromohalobacter moromii]
MHAANADAFWTLSPGHGEIRSQPLPPRDEDALLIRSHFSAVSRGTESLVFQGKVPESEYTRMRAPFQEGDFPGPVKYGYANVGVVEAGPAAWRGRDVFCLYPHQTRYVVPIEAVVPLPDDLPAARAILGANMETAINALWDAAPRIGDRITVIGAGVVGGLVAWLCRQIAGVRVQLLDIDADKAELAAALGVAFRHPQDAEGAQDVIIHASGSLAGLRSALPLAGYEAEIIELSWFGQDDVTLPLGEAFHSQRLTLRASQVGGVSPARRARRSHSQRLQLALSLLRDARLDALIDGESDFADLPTTLGRLSTAHRPGLCHRIRYP